MIGTPYAELDFGSLEVVTVPSSGQVGLEGDSTRQGNPLHLSTARQQTSNNNELPSQVQVLKIQGLWSGVSEMRDLVWKLRWIRLDKG